MKFSERLKPLLIQIGLKFGLLEERESFQTIRSVSTQGLHLPAGHVFEGVINTDLPVIVGGDFHGAINIQGGAPLVIMEGAKARGLFSADFIDLNTPVKDILLDTQRLTIGEKGSVTGDSQVLYHQIVKSDDSELSGLLQKRPNRRNGKNKIAHVVINKGLIEK